MLPVWLWRVRVRNSDTNSSLLVCSGIFEQLRRPQKCIIVVGLQKSIRSAPRRLRLQRLLMGPLVSPLWHTPTRCFRVCRTERSPPPWVGPVYPSDVRGALHVLCHPVFRVAHIFHFTLGTFLRPGKVLRPHSASASQLAFSSVRDTETTQTCRTSIICKLLAANFNTIASSLCISWYCCGNYSC